MFFSSSSRNRSYRDLSLFHDDLSDRSASLLPDGTTCYSARFFASKKSTCFSLCILALSPLFYFSIVFGGYGVRCASLILFATMVVINSLWLGLLYRKYTYEIRAGCHMQGVFIFRGTKDVVVRFHRAFGADVEASFSRDTIIGVSVQPGCLSSERRRPCCCCFEDCLVIESAGAGAPPRVVLPASWLVDSLHDIARDIDRHLEISHFEEI